MWALVLPGWVIVILAHWMSELAVFAVVRLHGRRIDELMFRSRAVPCLILWGISMCSCGVLLWVGAATLASDLPLGPKAALALYVGLCVVVVYFPRFENTRVTPAGAGGGCEYWVISFIHPRALDGHVQVVSRVACGTKPQYLAFLNYGENVALGVVRCGDDALDLFIDLPLGSQYRQILDESKTVVGGCWWAAGTIYVHPQGQLEIKIREEPRNTVEIDPSRARLFPDPGVLPVIVSESDPATTGWTR